MSCAAHFDKMDKFTKAGNVVFNSIAHRKRLEAKGRLTKKIRERHARWEKGANEAMINSIRGPKGSSEADKLKRIAESRARRGSDETLRTRWTNRRP